MKKSAKKKRCPVKKKTAKQLKIDEEMRVLKLDIRRQIKADQDERYNSVPLKTRREFIRLCHGNHWDVIAAAKELDIEFTTACLIFSKNTKKITRTILKQPDEVK